MTKLSTVFNCRCHTESREHFRKGKSKITTGSVQTHILMDVHTHGTKRRASFTSLFRHCSRGIDVRFPVRSPFLTTLHRLHPCNAWEWEKYSRPWKPTPSFNDVNLSFSVITIRISWEFGPSQRKWIVVLIFYLYCQAYSPNSRLGAL